MHSPLLACDAREERPGEEFFLRKAFEKSRSLRSLT